MRAYIIKECQNCGKEFSLPQSDERKRIKQFGVGAKFCSSKCSGIHKSLQHGCAEVNRCCLGCGQHFVVEKPSSKVKFCSQGCYSVSLKARNLDLLSPKIEEIKAYCRHNSLKAASSQYSVSVSWLNRHGIRPTASYRESCPDFLSELQTSVVNGNLLGDGSLTFLNKNQNSSFRLGQKLEMKEYVLGVKDLLSPFAIGYSETKRRKPSRVNGVISHDIEHWGGEYSYSCQTYTIRHRIFSDLRSKWYVNPDKPKSQKIVPKSLRLNWITAAMWMCDDGSNYPSCRKRYLTLYTDGFAEDDVVFLTHRINVDLGLEARICKRNTGFYIKLYGDNWFQFIENIRQHIPWSCFNYKCVNRPITNNNTSGFVGVRFRKSRSKWEAYTNINRKYVYIGCFDSAIEAAEARKSWLANYSTTL